MKEILIIMGCSLMGSGWGVAFNLALELSESRAEKQRAVAELTEVRVMAEWDRFEEGRGNYE
jgi:cyanate permease